MKAGMALDDGCLIPSPPLAVEMVLRIVACVGRSLEVVSLERISFHKGKL